jgi:hypothetical protein
VCARAIDELRFAISRSLFGAGGGSNLHVESIAGEHAMQVARFSPSLAR